MSVRADQIKLAKLIDMDRPGLAKPFMVPAKLKDQVRATPMTDLYYEPRGKTLVGQTQWVISMKRPGLAQPLITAKSEKLAADAVVQAMEAKAPAGAAQAAADNALVAAANENNKGNPGDQPSGVAGFFAGWGRRSRGARRRGR